MRVALPLLMILAALPALAQDRKFPLSEFEALVTGKTYIYQSRGQDYGAEEYLDNRRVRWSFLDGECLEGEYYARGSQVCFLYENYGSEQCWQFYLRDGHLLGVFEDDPTKTVLLESRQEDGPLYCKGPDVGV